MAESVTDFLGNDKSLGSTIQNLEGRLEGFSGEVQNVGKSTSELPAMFAKAAMAVATFVGAFIAAQVSIRTFMEAIAMGGELDNLSKRTGESAGNLAILQRAFQNAGMSAGDVGPTIGKLQKFIFEAGQEGTKQATILGWFGLTLQDLAAKTPTEIMQIFSEQLQKIEDPAKRAAAAQLLLGKSGSEAVPLFLELAQNIQAAKDQLGSYPEAINRSSAALNAIGSNIEAIKNKGVEFATGLLVNVAPALAEVTRKIAEIDATRLGMILSDHLAGFLRAADGALNFTKNLDAVKIAIQGLASGQISEGLSLMFVTGKIQALSLVNEFVRFFIAGLQTIGGFFSSLFDSKGALILLMTTVFGMVGNVLKENLYSALADFMSAIGRLKVAEAFRIQADTAANSFKMAMFGIGAQADLVGQQLFDAGAAMPKAFSANRSQLQPLFDLNPLLQQQDAYMQNIAANAAQTGQNLDGATAQFQSGAEAANASLSQIPAYGQSLAATADVVAQRGDSFRSNIEQSKMNVEVVAQRYEDISTEMGRTAQNVMIALEKIAPVFDSVIDAGINLEDSVIKSSEVFLDNTTKAANALVKGVQDALKQLTSADRNLATEKTLSQVVRELQTLNRNLPQAVIS